MSAEPLNGLDFAAELARVASLDELQYDRERVATAKRLGIRSGVLDAERRKIRGPDSDGKQLQGRALTLPEPDPWPEPVDGLALLADLASYFGRHLVLPPGGATLLSLWTVHAHCFDRFRHSPRLAIRSPEKGCGKTTVLDLVEMVVPRALPTANVTSAALFRAIEMAKPSLLIDEADTFLAASDDLRGILNAGHKAGGQVIRCVGDDAEPRAFAVFAPTAIAAIGALPSTIQDRSVCLMMRRAKAGERPEAITDAARATAAVLARKAARWSADHADALAACEPTMPAAVFNRAADNWKPLAAIAEIAGDGWPARLAKVIEAKPADDEDGGTLATLLADIKTIFKDRSAERLPTKQIAEALGDMDDRTWPELQAGKPISPNKLTRMLKPLDIARTQWRIPGTDERVWGFVLADFADAFARYLPGDPENKDQGLSPMSLDKVVTEKVRHQFFSPENDENHEHYQCSTDLVTKSPVFSEVGHAHTHSPPGWVDDPAIPAW